MKKSRTLQLLSALLVSAVALSGHTAHAGQKTDVVVGTAGTAGVYYVVGAALGKIINENSDMLNVIVQATNGAVENVNLVNEGDMEFGFCNSDGVYYAYEGIETFAKRGKQSILGLMSLYLSTGQMATMKKSGLKTYADLKGKKVCLGPPGSMTIDMSKAIFREYGIDPEKDITPYYLSIEEGCSKLVDGDLDATFMLAATPTAGLMNISTLGSVTMVDADPAILEKLIAKCPYYSLHVIKAGTYSGIDEDFNSIKVMTNIFVRPDVPDAVAYEFVRAIMENVDKIRDAHKVMSEIVPETVWQTPIPLHPGAVKYYKEIGVQ